MVIKRRLKALIPGVRAIFHQLYNIRHIDAFTADSIHSKEPSGGPKDFIGPPCHGVGIILTIIISIGFIWAIYQLSNIFKERNPLTREEIRANEIQVYKNLKSIADAQEKYIREDWDDDGKKTYAMFYVHLWRSISLASKPIGVNMIRKELAFAMDISGPLRGYYYLDLRKRRVDIKTTAEFDYTKEWGVAALPGNRGRTGVLTFITDQTKAIYVTAKMHSQPEYPHDPGGSGWTRIHTLEDLKEFQESISYPD